MSNLMTVTENEEATEDSRGEIDANPDSCLENECQTEGTDDDLLDDGVPKVMSEFDLVTERLAQLTIADPMEEVACSSGLAEHKSYGQNNSTSDSTIDEGDNLVPMVKTVKVDPIQFVAKLNRVNFNHLKEIMMSIITDYCGNKDNSQGGKDGSIKFWELLELLFVSPRLQRQTREDLTIHMASDALITLTNEFCLRLTWPIGEAGDITIYLPE